MTQLIIGALQPADFKSTDLDDDPHPQFITGGGPPQKAIVSSCSQTFITWESSNLGSTLDEIGSSKLHRPTQPQCVRTQLGFSESKLLAPHPDVPCHLLTNRVGQWVNIPTA